MCNLEQVSKKWNTLAKETWRVKNELIMDPETIYGMPNNHDNCKRMCYMNLFDGLLNRKIDPASLKSIDISSIVMLSSDHLTKILKMIEEKCFNLNGISFMPFKMEKDRKLIERYLKSNSVKYLKHLTLCESLVDDTFLDVIFDNCKELTSFKISEFAQTRVTGECFDKISLNLTKVFFISCFKIERSQFISLFQKCKNITDLTITEPPSDILFPIIDNLTKLKKLCITIKDSDEHQFQYLETLKCLENVRLFDKTTNEETLGNFFSNCVALKHAEIIKYTYAKKQLKFKEFKSPLESFKFTDFRDFNLDHVSFFEALKDRHQTFKSLSIPYCENFTSEDIIDLMTHCKNLNYLKLNETNIDNSCLENALKLTDRNIYIECLNTNCNCEIFLSDKSGYIFKSIDDDSNFIKNSNNNNNNNINLYEICLNNLTFLINF